MFKIILVFFSLISLMIITVLIILNQLQNSLLSIILASISGILNYFGIIWLFNGGSFRKEYKNGI